MTVQSLHQLLMHTFAMTNAWLVNSQKPAQATPTYVKSVSVPWRIPGQNPVFRVTVVHEGNLEAVLRLLGVAGGTLCLNVEFFDWP